MNPQEDVIKVLKENYTTLKNIPGVKDVGYGFKYKDSKKTSTVAIIVSLFISGKRRRERLRSLLKFCSVAKVGN